MYLLYTRFTYLSIKILHKFKIFCGEYVVQSDGSCWFRDLPQIYKLHKNPVANMRSIVQFFERGASCLRAPLHFCHYFRIYGNVFLSPIFKLKNGLPSRNPFPIFKISFSNFHFNFAILPKQLLFITLLVYFVYLTY